MTIIEAYIGGIHNFFSIWFFCLFQVTPFFLAYITGLTMMEVGDKRWQGSLSGIITGGVLCLIGFMTGYIIIGASATSISNIIFGYLAILNQLGGVILLLMGLYFIGLFRIAEDKGKLFRRFGGLLVGLSFAFAYQPCVTPTLTSIYNLTKSSETVSGGTIMLSFYSLGISTAFTLIGFTISKVLSADVFINIRGITQRISGGILIIMSILILANWMTIYKSYLVGWLLHEH
ncbi:MAG: cytochrome c biogenesis protein CcdA [Nitrospinota bacterium]